MSTTTITPVELGRGRLGWHRHERVGSRYGTVNFWPGDDEHPTFNAAGDLPDGLLGSTGTLQVEITEPRKGNHIGDGLAGFHTSGPLDKGTMVELGHGELFVDDRGVGLKPDRELLIPDHPYRDFPDCEVCEGDGYTPEARWVEETFYCLGVEGPGREQLRWCNKITQEEVDMLVERGRLGTFNSETRKWEKKPRTAEEINRANDTPSGMDGHDGINRMLLVHHRIEKLGIVAACPNCDGHGNIASDEEREAETPWPADREINWLDPTAIYRVQNQGVILTFTPDPTTD